MEDHQSDRNGEETLLPEMRSKDGAPKGSPIMLSECMGQGFMLIADERRDGNFNIQPIYCAGCPACLPCQVCKGTGIFPRFTRQLCWKCKGTCVTKVGS